MPAPILQTWRPCALCTLLVRCVRISCSWNEDRVPHCRAAGRTDAGVPIVVFIPKNLQVDTDAQRERALTYFLRTMDAVCSAPYVLIYCHATMSWFSRT